MRAAQGLARRGLVRREPNQADGRSHRLLLTRSGVRIYRDIVPLALEHEMRLLRGLKPRDIARLDQLLRQLEHTAHSS
jgi:DNA-binding MarR family transcriptional regulator